MRHGIVFSTLVMAHVLAGCGDRQSVIEPENNLAKWGWDTPLGTGGGYDPVLICSPGTVAHMGTVTCVFANGGPLYAPVWKFYTTLGIEVNGPVGNTGQWAGKMVESGTVVVNWIDPSTGSPGSPLYHDIIVQPRPWSWASLVSGQTGTPGEIDSCFPSSLPLSWSTLGLTARVSCTEATASVMFQPAVIDTNGTGYVAARIDAGTSKGPNQGLWYVDTVTASVNVRTQYTKKFRADGDTVTFAGLHEINQTVAEGCFSAFGNTLGRNHRTVNTVCIPTPAFAADTACSWGHEAMHMDSVITASKRAANDVYKLFEPKVAASKIALYNMLSSEYVGSWDRVFRNADSAHYNMTSTTNTYYYRVPGFPWNFGGVTHRCP